MTVSDLLGRSDLKSARELAMLIPPPAPHPNTWGNWRKAGLPAVKICGRWYYPLPEFLEFIAQKSTTNAAGENHAK
jgi:hypothetical protein